jgi:DNA-binding XRE family transcriptional regulator
LPFLPHVPLKEKKPKPKPYAESPQTIGEHLKRTRLIRGLTQAQAAAIIGVSSFTIINWEKDRTQPPVEASPAILSFLGYDPFPLPETLPERLLAKRRVMGWTIAEAAHRLGVDGETWGAWEFGRITPRLRYLQALEYFLQ